MKIAAVTLVVLVIISFIPFQQQASINIRANYFDVCQQLRSADNWQRWQPDIRSGFDKAGQNKLTTDSSGFLISMPGQAFKVENINANTFKVTRTASHIDHSYFYIVVPGIAHDNTTVIVDVKNSVGKWLFSQLTSSGDMLHLPGELKNFMENARLYYGFSISEKKMDEACMAVKKETIAVKSKYTGMAEAVKDLHGFLDQNNMQALPGLSAVYYPQKKDSVEMLIGIPVNKQLNSTGSIAFMRMPGGKWLTGDYKGKYSGRQQLYNAMEKYMQDHSLSKQIAPFEKYLDNKPPVSDDDVVHMQVNYPVL